MHVLSRPSSVDPLISLQDAHATCDDGQNPGLPRPVISIKDTTMGRILRERCSRLCIDIYGDNISRLPSLAEQAKSTSKSIWSGGALSDPRSLICRWSRYPLLSARSQIRRDGPIRVCHYCLNYFKAKGAENDPDIDPVRKEDRKWGVIALLAYWGSDAFSPAAMEQASSILALGLSSRDALVTIAVGFFIIAIVISLNGATGVLYHAPFPVLSRASWGFLGSYSKIVSLNVVLLEMEEGTNLRKSCSTDHLPSCSRYVLVCNTNNERCIHVQCYDYCNLAELQTSTEPYS